MKLVLERRKGMQGVRDQRGVITIFIALLSAAGFAAVLLLFNSALSWNAKNRTIKSAKVAAVNLAQTVTRSVGGDGEVGSLKARAVAKALPSAITAVGNAVFGNSSTLTTTTSDGLQVQLGQYISQTEKLGMNPCGDGSEAPCFRSVDPTVEPETIVNAFRIVGSTPAKVSEVAVIRPREVCFLVDVSRSTVEKSHPKNVGNLSTGDEFAFMIRNDQQPQNRSLKQQCDQQCRWDGTVGVSCSATTCPSPSGSAAQSLTAAGHSWSSYKTVTISNETVAPLQSANRSPTTPGLTDEESALTGVYRVDIERRPEPLADIIKAVREGIVEMRETGSEGDKVCLIAFDSRPSWRREFNLRSVRSPEVGRLIELLDWDNDEPDRDFRTKGKRNMIEAFQQGLFPATNGATDILGSLNAGFMQFKEFGAQFGNRSIVLISDGRVNCSPCQRAVAARGESLLSIDSDDIAALDACAKSGQISPICRWADINGDGSVNSEDRNILVSCSELSNQVSCSDNYCSYLNAIRRPGGLTYQSSRLARARIRLHTLLTSPLTGPHIVDVEDSSNPGTCLDEDEVRRRGLDFARGFSTAATSCYGTAFNERNSIWADNQQPFWEVGQDFWRAAMVTGGEFVPIRPSAEELSTMTSFAQGCGSCLPGECCPGQRRCIDTTSLKDRATVAIKKILASQIVSLSKINN